MRFLNAVKASLLEALPAIAGVCSPLTAELARLSRLVVQDLLNLLHDIWGELGQQGDRLAVVLDLGDLLLRVSGDNM